MNRRDRTNNQNTSTQVRVCTTLPFSVRFVIAININHKLPTRSHTLTQISFETVEHKKYIYAFSRTYYIILFLRKLFCLSNYMCDILMEYIHLLLRSSSYMSTNARSAYAFLLHYIILLFASTVCTSFCA